MHWSDFVFRSYLLAMRDWIPLPNEFQRKLNDTVIHLCRSELPEQSIRRSIRVERTEVTGRRKVSVIQDIEKLRAELQVESLGNSWDPVVLEQGEIHIKQPWSNNRIAPDVAANVCT